MKIEVCPTCNHDLIKNGNTYSCTNCNKELIKVSYCPTCNDKLEKLAACGSVSFWCNSCNELKSKKEISTTFEEK